MEEHQAAVEAREPRHLPPDEDTLLAPAWAVEVGLHRRRDRPCAEERAPGRAVSEARVRQVDPPRGVELPTVERVATGRPLRLIARELGHLARQASNLDRRIHDEGGACAIADRLGHTTREARDHSSPAQ